MKFIKQQAYPNHFTELLFNSIADRINAPCDQILISTIDFENLLRLDFEHRIVLIGLYDHLLSQNLIEYDYWNPSVPTQISEIVHLSRQHPDRLFVLLIMGYHWNISNFQNLSNIRVLHWNAIHTNNTYHNLKPVIKNFESRQIAISLNRLMRCHRLFAISLLYGLGLEKHCLITASNIRYQLSKLSSDNFLEHNNFVFEEHHDLARETVIKGFKKLIEDFNSGSSYHYGGQIYPLVPNTEIVIMFDNYSNFENNLRSAYQNSFVEIVGCRLGVDPGVSIDEKMINSVYARNFPVLIGSTGTVKFYRNLGIDMFDDVIDHSYDQIDNPVDRFYKAIVDNKHLITDTDQTKKIWQARESRFDENIDRFNNNEIYNNLRQKTLMMCNQVIPDLLLHPFMTTSI
jgi:hypothetical protein